jgi:hypothetical protein
MLIAKHKIPPWLICISLVISFNFIYKYKKGPKNYISIANTYTLALDVLYNVMDIVFCFIFSIL